MISTNFLYLSFSVATLRRIIFPFWQVSYLTNILQTGQTKKQTHADKIVWNYIFQHIKDKIENCFHAAFDIIISTMSITILSFLPTSAFVRFLLSCL